MKRCVYILLLLCSIQCREKYDVFIDVPDRGLLVVEGFVNGNGKTTITLSRTTKLSEKRIQPEPRAVLRIEGEDNSVNYLYETDEGTYVTDSIFLEPAVNYRLKIFTEDRNEYESDYRSLITTPPIDSITWQYRDGIVDFFAHSNNSSNRSIYYKWDYEETWEFKSTFRAMLQYKITGEGDNAVYEIEYYDPIDHKPNESIFTCWKSNKSTGIVLGSAAQQGERPINLPVRTLPRNAWELSYRYSILVEQYGLREDSYEFFRRMKKNSENLGTIFDAQPSQLFGNMVCTTDSAIDVIGFVEFSTVTQKRFFVLCELIPGVPYDPDCPFWVELDPTFPPYPYANDPAVIIQVYKHRGLLPTIPQKTAPGGFPITFYAERPRCVDCRLRGTNVKPDFWP